jgi:hypothetical protein
MKRPDKYVTETCGCCGRPGWTRKVHYALLTQEETGSYVIEVEGLPKGFTPMCCYGGTIYEAVQEAIEYCQTCVAEGVGFEFNGQTILVTAYSDAIAVVDDWWYRVYHETPEESFAKR